MPAWDQLLGPLGALVLALAGIAALGRALQTLWIAHMDADARERARTTEAEDRLDAALAGLKAHTDVTDKAVALAEALVGRLEGGRRAR